MSIMNSSLIFSLAASFCVDLRKGREFTNEILGNVIRERLEKMKSLGKAYDKPVYNPPLRFLKLVRRSAVVH
jgi:hypothetical protein